VTQNKGFKQKNDERVGHKSQNPKKDCEALSERKVGRTSVLGRIISGL